MCEPENWNDESDEALRWWEIVGLLAVVAFLTATDWLGSLFKRKS